MTLKARLLALSVFLTVGASLAPAWAGVGLWRNTRNTPFSAATNGPQGAIVVQEPLHPAASDLLPATREQRIHEAIAAQHPISALNQAVRAARFLKRNHLAGRRSDPRFPRLIVHTRGGRLLLPNLQRAIDTGQAIGDPGNTITFTYEGWSGPDQQALESYLQTAMPVARSVYGPPAFNITVNIIQDSTLHVLQGGTYDVTTNELRLPPPSGNFPEDTAVLMMLVLEAFHDDVALFYDSWEEGMAGAAATVVQITPGVMPGYDPANPGPFYSGSVYEPNNQPPLGNSTWYPASGFSGMLVWRIAQARAAWYKCVVENAGFFNRFNAQFYATLNSLPSDQAVALLGDTRALVQICAGASVLPQVEGLPFWAWYRQQYALDTSVTVGPKLFTWNVPLTDSVILVVEYYETDPTGNETPLGGTAYTIYWSWDFTKQLFAQEGNEIVIPPTGDSAGEGFLIPTFYNIGGPQCITVQIEINGLWARYPYANGVRAFDPGQPNIYGAIIGPTEGTINVTGPGVNVTAPVTQGVWSVVATKTALSPMQLVVTFTDAQSNTVSRTVNVAFDSYDVLLTAGAQAGVAHSFPVGQNGLYLMSVPVLPLLGDPAAALGIPPDQFMLARWKPNATGGGGYDIYPAIDSFQPGRGYWLKVLSDVTVGVDGIAPPTTDDVVVQLYAGWNMIGCARSVGVDLGQLLLQRGASDSSSWDDAVTNGWIQSGVWGYDQTNGYSPATQLAPWGGYWVRCLLPEGLSLIFPADSGAAAQARAQRPRVATAASPFGRTAWTMPLVLQVGAFRSTATMGAAATARDGYDVRHDLLAPPALADQPALRFVHADWGANSGEYLSDIRGVASRGPWRLRVTGVPPGVRALLRWPDLSSLPLALQPVLVDPVAQRQVSLRTTASYDFVGTNPPREFTIELRSASASAPGIK